MAANNNLFQKNANTSMVAQLIWRQEGISRIDISRQLKLNKSTVSNIISYLLEAGIVEEGERKDSCAQGGRKAIELTISKKFGCVFGFDLQTSHYRSVIMSVDGSILWETRGQKNHISFESFVCSVVDEAFAAHKSIGIPVLALTFSVSGQVDPKKGEILFSHPFRLKNFRLKDFLRARYDYPIYVENDANCAAWLDLHSTLGATFRSNAVSIFADFHEESKRNESIIGIGAGFGVIIDGTVYRGSHNAAGEFCSVTWGPGNNNQSGLSVDVLRRTIDEKECFIEWLKDTFQSLVPLLSIMDFEQVILHGTPFADEEWVRAMLEEHVPSFTGILKRCNCGLIFNADDEAVSAKGAALMYLHELYSVPDLEDDLSDKWTWSEVVEYSQRQLDR